MTSRTRETDGFGYEDPRLYLRIHRDFGSYSSAETLIKLLIYAFLDIDNFAKDWYSKLKARAESLNK